MATAANTKAAEALYATLSVFHSIAGQSLKAVRQVYAEGCLDKVVLDFGSTSLLVVADANDDSIDFRIAEAAEVTTLSSIDASLMEPWTRLIGKRFGWGWMALSQQGYCDALLLSFNEVVFPEVVLTVIASSIKFGAITKLS